MTKTVTIYTDGACSGNPGPGGWGAILCWNGHEKVLSGGEAHTTNNRMELTGVKDVSGFDENTVILTTDMGDVTVRGQGLHIDKIDLDAGTVELKGKVNEFSYDETSEHGTFWTRLFG